MRRILGIIVGLFSLQVLFCQSSFNNKENTRGDLRIMFYNTENLFDTFNDSLTNDEEFLPKGDKNWTYNRFRSKIINLYKTIVAIGENEPPEIICLAEVENKFVLLELINNTPLEKYSYEIVHFESPDRRGIDVGLLYRKDVIKSQTGHAIKIEFPNDLLKTTRDILYFEAVFNSGDTLYVFVNHWPSRVGGATKSEPFRMRAASVLRKSVDSLLFFNPCAQVIITGDFNDDPSNSSIKDSLQVKNSLAPFYCNKLYNLSERLSETCQCGTYRYRSTWNMFDQFIVSGALLTIDHGLKTCDTCIQIADFDFLLIDDEKFGGNKPYRTYLGPVYKGGFSDHLPIYLDLYY